MRIVIVGWMKGKRSAWCELKKGMFFVTVVDRENGSGRSIIICHFKTTAEGIAKAWVGWKP